MREEFSFAVIPDIHLKYLQFDLYDRLIACWNRLRGGKREGVAGKDIEERLLSAVARINSLPEIKFAVTAGDLNQGGLLKDGLRVKEILNQLKVPWLPVLGNHELLPFTLTFHWGGKSKGITYFEEVFKERFQLLSDYFKDWEKAKSSRQNYAFTYQSARFIVVDNVNRRQTPLSKRTQMRFLEKETKEWLKIQLARGERKKIVLSHSPLSRGLLNAFSKNTNAQIVNIAGHWHKKIIYSRESITTFITDSLYQKPVITIVKVLPDEIQFQTVRIP